MNTLTTPELVFPALALLLGAYTNRSLALAGVLRGVYSQPRSSADPGRAALIAWLQHRLRLVRDMQLCGVGSLFLCALAMLLTLLDQAALALYTFSSGLALMLGSLAIALREICLSVAEPDPVALQEELP